MNGWLKFFLTAVIETAKSGVDTFKQILTLKQEIDSVIFSFGKKSQNAKALVDFLYQKPIISSADIIEPLGVSKPTANLLLSDFVEKGILIEVTGLQRNKLYSFERYLNIFSKV